MARPNWHGSYELRDRRIEAGTRAVLDIFSRILPNGSEPLTISPELANGLRAALAQSGAYQGVERGVVSLSLEPIEPGRPVARGVMLPEAVYAALMNELGMPNILSAPHGSCATCVFNKDGREGGYDAPCVSCGAGHPCHESRLLPAESSAGSPSEASACTPATDEPK